MNWNDIAAKWVRDMLPRLGEFSANDLWAAGLPDTDNRRNLSKVLLRLERDGLIERVGKTASIGGHGQEITVWRAV